jgi:DNA-binding MltR family transcriptional regulator
MRRGEAEFPSSESGAIARSLMKESDRGCVIFSASLLAQALEVLLRAAFVSGRPDVAKVVDPLFRAYAPLSTYSARIDVAFALGLVGEDIYGQLHLIRRMRNDFAHEVGDIDFDDLRVRDRLRNFIADGGTAAQHPDDAEEVRFGSQFLEKRQVVNRVAFAIRVSKLLGRLDACREAATAGHRPWCRCQVAADETAAGKGEAT